MRLLEAAIVLFALALPVPGTAQELADSQAGAEGRQLGEQGQWPQARAVLESATRKNPSDASVLFWLARAAEETGDYERAQEAFRRLLLLPEGSSDAIEMQARSLREHVQAARRLVEQARALFRQPKLHGKAANLLAAAQVLAPRLWEIGLEQGRLAHLKGAWDEAIAAYRSAIRYKGEAADLYGYLALAQFRRAGLDPQGLEEAFLSARRAVELRGGDPQLARRDATDFDLMGVIRYNQGRYKEAGELFRRAQEKDPAARIYREHQNLSDRRANF